MLITGGIVGAASAQNAKYDYPRLQRAVEALLEAHEQLRRENEEFREALEQRQGRILDLEGALREQQQRRADAITRIDALVGQLEDLDGRLERAEEATAAGAGAASSMGNAAP